MNLPTIDQLVNQLGLKPLWSDDYLIEFYQSDLEIPKEIIGNRFDGARPIFNWAYYLLPENVLCPFHMHLADESWQLCLGGPMELFLIYPQDGRFEHIILGPDVMNGQHLIYITPKDAWIAAKTSKNAKYSLITHLVSPGFFPQDNKKGYYEDLITQFPEHSEIIKEFAWPKTWN